MLSNYYDQDLILIAKFCGNMLTLRGTAGQREGKGRGGEGRSTNMNFMLKMIARFPLPICAMCCKICAASENLIYLI